VVTGARRGIGRGLAIALAHAGADIVAVSRHPATELAADVEGAGRRCVLVTADLEDPAQVDRIIPDTVRAAGRVALVEGDVGPALGLVPGLGWRPIRSRFGL